MEAKAGVKDWLPLARTGRAAGELPTGQAFQPEWIDFENGIRIGRLEPHERITQMTIYHPMPAQEVQGCTGFELVKAMTAVFDEVIPAMNTCMQIGLMENTR